MNTFEVLDQDILYQDFTAGMIQVVFGILMIPVSWFIINNFDINYLTVMAGDDSILLNEDIEYEEEKEDKEEEQEDDNDEEIKDSHIRTQIIQYTIENKEDDEIDFIFGKDENVEKEPGVIDTIKNITQTVFDPNTTYEDDLKTLNRCTNIFKNICNDLNNSDNTEVKKGVELISNIVDKILPENLKGIVKNPEQVEKICDSITKEFEENPDNNISEEFLLIK